MPLGDSITSGEGFAGGYRNKLWDNLVAANVPVDFVGSQFNGQSSLGDKDNEGHPGFRIDELSAGADGWALSYHPSVVLLMAGTNNVLQGDPAFSNGPAQLSALIDILAARLPDANIVVASLTPLADSTYEQRVQAFNAQVPGIVSQKMAEGKKVHFLDMHAVVPASDLSDGIHPNSVGYGKMADAWFGVIQNILNANGAPSASITSPLDGAIFNAPASITIDANAAGADGHVSRFEFYDGATKFGEDATAP